MRPPEGERRKSEVRVIKHWIEVGQPDDKRMLRACGRADRVTVYAYGNRPELWCKPLAEKIKRAKNLAVWRIPPAAVQALEKLGLPPIYSQRRLKARG